MVTVDRGPVGPLPTATVPAVRACSGAAGAQLLDGVEKLALAEWFGQPSQWQRRHSGWQLGIAGDQQNRQVRPTLPCHGCQLRAIHKWHRVVGDEHVYLSNAQQIQRFAGRASGDDVVACGFKHAGGAE